MSLEIRPTLTKDGLESSLTVQKTPNGDKVGYKELQMAGIEKICTFVEYVSFLLSSYGTGSNTENKRQK